MDIQAIQTMITDMLGPFGPLIIVGLLGVFLILVTLPILMKREVDPLDRLKTSGASVNGKKDKSKQLRQAGGKDSLEKYSNFLEPKNADEYSATKLKLLQAGYSSNNAVRMYHFAQFGLGVIGLVLGCIFAFIKIAQGDVTTQNLVFMILIPGIVGYILPKFWVGRRRKARNEAITNAFPDCLDMMLVCVEAGQSLDQSIVRVSSELKSGFPDLAGEFEIVSQEMKAGKDKNSVLKDMAERCDVQDITSFVTVLVQSQQFGTSISDALRVYSSEMRDKRVMRAEEKANKLPVKMTLATMMFTVPPLMAMLMAPSIYTIATKLG